MELGGLGTATLMEEIKRIGWYLPAGLTWLELLLVLEAPHCELVAHKCRLVIVKCGQFRCALVNFNCALVNFT